ncbi:MAG: hypothetical protein JWP30_1114 [Homoserinimonas sp.]|jgi:hypothetical protein|nr:hypothetical protein [Homoserinimonas sp.]
MWWDIALWAVALWLSALMFQIADLGTAWFDLRTAKSGTGQLARRRAHQLFWVAPVAALVAFVLAFAVDFAASLVFDRGWLLVSGLLLALTVIVLVAAASGVALVALLTRDSPSYALLRYRLGESRARKVSRLDIEAWRSELHTIDTREAVRHEDIARPLRLIPIAIATLAFFLVCTAVTAGFPTDGAGWVVAGILALLMPASSVLLAARAARVSLRARAAWTLVNSKQRTEVLKALDELERRTGRGVAGLSDRVNRALQILREQQQRNE